MSINGVYSGLVARWTLAHRKSHDGCPLMPGRFTGTPRMNPQALA
ncbi:hypothetical protein ACRAWG_31355 [Methylobacterium sp. P31]